MASVTKVSPNLRVASNFLVRDKALSLDANTAAGFSVVLELVGKRILRAGEVPWRR